MNQISNQKPFENFFLALHKPWEKDKRKLLFPIEDSEKEKNSMLLKRFIGERADLQNFRFDSDQIKGICQRQKLNALDLLGESWRVGKPLIKSPQWRLIVGIGGGSIYETAILLHHIYGIPYIPGTALKGVTHHHALNQEFDQIKIDEIFGQDELPEESINGSQGRIIFFDAFPIESPTIEPDVMTPHYPDYYGKTKPKPPADWQSPNPIGFLTVGHQTKFQFILGIKRKFGTEDEIDKALLTLALAWLEEALQFRGIGAKTAVGYGYMQKQ